MQQYALYKGDNLLGIGTAKELAKRLGVSKKTIYFYQTPSNSKRSKDSNKRRVLIKL